MPSLSDTIARLARIRALPPGATFGQADRLTNLTGFGTNPGALRARIYLPDNLQPDAPLVVVLHGCTQNAAGYDAGSGWSQLADRHGFALLFPEQTRANNANLCFNWFEPAHTMRDAGEPLSIRQMVGAMLDRYALDPARVFVTGLSAGGAMTSVMLATYPEVFAGGAIIAGLPYGTAANMPQAFDRMRGHGGAEGSALAALVRAASPHRAKWPTLSVWHGTADQTVSRTNAAAIVDQWRPLHGLAREPTWQETIEGYPHRVWCAPDGRALIEEYEIIGIGHGTPLATSGEGAVGAAMPYMLEAGISSTRHIAAFWGIADAVAAESALPVTNSDIVAPFVRPTPAPRPTAAANSGVGKVIEDALRAAGLMR